MIKHTPHDHPDHGSLQLALGEIKTLADRMNRGEKEVDQAEREAERLRDLEATIEGMTNVINWLLFSFMAIECILFNTLSLFCFFSPCVNAFIAPLSVKLLV